MSVWGARWGARWGNRWGSVLGGVSPTVPESGYVTSGTYADDLRVGDAIDEAFERCGIDPALLTLRHLHSARRSFQLLFSDWANKNIKLWTVDLVTASLTAGTATYLVDKHTVSVLEMMVRRQGVDTPVYPMSRDEYMRIPNKTHRGLPTKFYLNRKRVQPDFTLWHVPDNSTDVILYYRMNRLQDAGAMFNGMDVPYRWLEATTAGLAEKLALKYAPDRFAALKMEAKEKFDSAFDEDRERHDTQFSFS